MEKATFGGGCFWCTEAVFKRIRGVSKVVSGYTGGEKENPTYQEVSMGGTGHAEAIQITFDPKKVSYEDLLYVFFKTHDPTEVNRQGPDVGTQYRSEVFYHDEEQKELAEKMVKRLKDDYDSPIATEITPFDKFYEAEGYHQDYYERNKGKRYCQVIIDPKLKKLQDKMKDYLKDED